MTYCTYNHRDRNYGAGLAVRIVCIARENCIRLISGGTSGDELNKHIG